MSATIAGLVSAFAGFAGSFAIVLQGLGQMGASPAEAASGLMALAVAMGALGIWLSLAHRMPISMAWSTPGAALLASSEIPAGGFGEAVGAFLVTGALVVIASYWRPLARAIAAIPKPLAQAMLAGVLLPLCLVPFQAVAVLPDYGLPILGAWLIVGQVNRLMAVPAAVAVAGALVALRADIAGADLGTILAAPVLVTPALSAASVIGIALPLFIVTMASQNITGIAVLNGFGYRPDPQPLFRWAGVFSLAAAPLGGHGVNLAAITAAICANPDAHPDPARRYWAAVVAGALYAAFGLMAGGVVALAALAPPLVLGAVAGLALIGALTGALAGALAEEDMREPAILTVLVAASGLTLLGISGAFWGLVAGAALIAWQRWRRA